MSWNIAHKWSFIFFLYFWWFLQTNYEIYCQLKSYYMVFQINLGWVINKVFRRKHKCCSVEHRHRLWASVDCEAINLVGITFVCNLNSVASLSYEHGLQEDIITMRQNQIMEYFPQNIYFVINSHNLIRRWFLDLSKKSKLACGKTCCYFSFFCRAWPVVDSGMNWHAQ